MSGLSKKPYKGTRDFFPAQKRMQDYLFKRLTTDTQHLYWIVAGEFNFRRFRLFHDTTLQRPPKRSLSGTEQVGNEHQNSVPQASEKTGLFHRDQCDHRHL